MKQFIVIYYAPAELMASMPKPAPEDMEKNMKPWMDWAERCGDGLVDLGAPLGGGQAVSDAGSTASQRDVAGYSILQAEDMDKAKEMLKGHPHLAWDKSCAIEVYEAMPLPK